MLDVWIKTEGRPGEALGFPKFLAIVKGDNSSMTIWATHWLDPFDLQSKQHHFCLNSSLLKSLYCCSILQVKTSIRKNHPHPGAPGRSPGDLSGSRCEHPCVARQWWAPRLVLLESRKTWALKVRMASLPVFAYIMLTKMCGMYNIYIYTSNYDYIPYVYNIIYIYICMCVLSRN